MEEFIKGIENSDRIEEDFILSVIIGNSIMPYIYEIQNPRIFLACIASMVDDYAMAHGIEEDDLPDFRQWFYSTILEAAPDVDDYFKNQED